MIAPTGTTAATPLASVEQRPVDLPSIAVVIPNWNGAAVLPACLGSLRDQSSPPACVCVVDNGSTDGSAAMAAARDPALQIVALPSNAGFGVAVNAGIAATTCDWVLVLNNDTRLEPETIKYLALAADACATDVGALQPLLLLDDDTSRVNSTGIEVRTNGEARDRDFGVPLWSASPPGEVFGATGGAALLRRSMLLKIAAHAPVFDPSFFMYFEDVDLAWRAQLAGWRTLFVPQAVVHHRYQATSARQPDGFVAVQCTLNRVRCLTKNASWRLMFRSARRTLGDLRWLFRRLGGQALRRWLSAVWDGLRQRRGVSRLAVRRRRDVEGAWVQRPPSVRRVRFRRELDA